MQVVSTRGQASPVKECRKLEIDSGLLWETTFIILRKSCLFACVCVRVRACVRACILLPAEGIGFLELKIQTDNCELYDLGADNSSPLEEHQVLLTSKA